MPIFLDYALNQDGIFALSIRESNGFEHDFDGMHLQDAIEYLIEPGHIVVFERPIRHLEKELGELWILEDHPLRERWLDIFKFIKRETGKDTSLSKVAEASVGFGPQSDIVKLPRAWALSPSLDLFQKMHDRLRALQHVYDYAEFAGELRFFHKTDEIIVEVDILEPALP